MCSKKSKRFHRVISFLAIFTFIFSNFSFALADLRPNHLRTQQAEENTEVVNIGTAANKIVNAKIEAEIKAGNAVELIRSVMPGGVVRYSAHQLNYVDNYSEIDPMDRATNFTTYVDNKPVWDQMGESLYIIEDHKIIEQLDKFSFNGGKRIVYFKGQSRILSGDRCFVHVGRNDQRFFIGEYALAEAISNALTSKSDLLARVAKQEKKRDDRDYNPYRNKEEAMAYKGLLAEMRKLAEDIEGKDAKLTMLSLIERKQEEAAAKPTTSKKINTPSVAAPVQGKYVYLFGPNQTEGSAAMKNLLGGKGANLAEMAALGLPVPAGFTLTTGVCTIYMNTNGYPKELQEQVLQALRATEETMGAKFGDPDNPLLVSVRSGARSSMPGMMETVLNIGLTTKTMPGLIAKTKNERFVWDSYRRLIMMYSDVVMEKAAGIELEDENMGIRKQLEKIMDERKQYRSIKNDTELDVEDLKFLCAEFKKKIQEVLKKEFPDDPQEQLWGAIGAVFSSWNGKKAVSYRRIENIPDEWGTAVNVQAMVFGNMGEDSATGVAFTRDPATGDNKFYGEWLVNAQGEDVVAGIRTPSPLNEATKNDQNKHLDSLEQGKPKLYEELDHYRNVLGQHYRDMLDIEFTIEDGKLWMLQCRVGKRTGTAAVKMALDMLKEGMIKPEEAVLRVTPEQLDELLHPIIDPAVERDLKTLATGLPAGPGGAVGRIVFSASEAVEWVKKNKDEKVVLVRAETNPEDVEGMRVASGILTATGGMTSHAALVARGWGKCCIVGCSDLHIDLENKTFTVGGETFKEGDWISLNGTKGNVYPGQLAMIKPTENKQMLDDFLALCDSLSRLKVRANADTPADAAKARYYGAVGIGLLRSEHMFYGKGTEEALFLMRKMIICKTAEERQKVLAELFPHVKSDAKGVLEAMDGLPVTIRLLDPPLHEFVPEGQDKRAELAKSLGISIEELNERAEALHEDNPMIGHRGVRLGVTYPEITEMWAKAIFEAAADLIKEGKNPLPEIMVPVVSDAKEISHEKEIVDRVYKEVITDKGLDSIPYTVGTMIEIPRASLTAGEVAKVSAFFSFGTNDLTQMTFGFSRDDINGFLPDYLDQGVLKDDPFQTIDQKGVGSLMKTTIEQGRAVKPDLKIGICGEQGGDPRSVEFCHKLGMSYVSCSPFRVPIARLAAAQAAIKEKQAKAQQRQDTFRKAFASAKLENARKIEVVVRDGALGELDKEQAKKVILAMKKGGLYSLDVNFGKSKHVKDKAWTIVELIPEGEINTYEPEGVGPGFARAVAIRPFKAGELEQFYLALVTCVGFRNLTQRDVINTENGKAQAVIELFNSLNPSPNKVDLSILQKLINPHKKIEDLRAILHGIVGNLPEAAPLVGDKLEEFFKEKEEEIKNI